MLQAR